MKNSDLLTQIANSTGKVYYRFNSDVKPLTEVKNAVQTDVDSSAGKISVGDTILTDLTTSPQLTVNRLASGLTNPNLNVVIQVNGKFYPIYSVERNGDDVILSANVM